MRTVFRALTTLLIAALSASLMLADDRVATNSNTEASVTSADEAIGRFLERERELENAMRRYQPMVETYLQALRSDPELSFVPADDRYFIGRLDLSDPAKESMYVEAGPRGAKKLLAPFRRAYAIDFMPIGFSAMIFVDRGGLTRQAYEFQFVRREFLGDIRCLVFQVNPKDKNRRGRFLGRIWVEDKDYNIVRFNGTYINPPPGGHYFHMDSWRANLQPGLWLPSAVYSEESNLQYSIVNRHMSFKAQTRLWAYDIKRFGRQDEFTEMVVDSQNAVKDHSESAQDSSPVLSLRAWQREAEENVLERLEKSAVLAAPGEVDKILETVANNLIITNNLNIQPEVHCRVLLTSPLESFRVGHTIVISRGFLDVLPDEASLAMVLSHELAHIVMGDLVDTKYSFADRMLFADNKTYSNFRFSQDERQQEAADKRAIEYLKNSPYKDKLDSAGLFLRQLQARAANLPNLSKPHLGNGFVAGGRVVRMTELMNAAPALQMGDIHQVAALPLGGRIKLDPWNDTVSLLKTKPVQLQSIREKMPFEIAPVMPHLMRLNTTGDLAVAAVK